MGQLEALTALALGRGHYEDEVVWNPDANKANCQRYNSRGHPEHPETKKRERDHIRAANEVMQVAGIVEDTATARLKSSQDVVEKQLESFVGFRLIEFGRACLHTGVWGVIGLRRRILLYRPYTIMKIKEILVQETQKCSVSRLFFSGLPMALIPLTSDCIILALEKLFDFNCRPGTGSSSVIIYTNNIFLKVVEFAFSYIKAQCGLLSILQQLYLIPESKIFPCFMSLIPFSTTSTIKFNPKPSTNISLFSLSLSKEVLQTAGPLLVIIGYNRIRTVISSIIYRYVYRALPRPTGANSLPGIPVDPLTVEASNPDQYWSSWYSLPIVPCASAASDSEAHTHDFGHDGSDEEDSELNHAQLISFDVEPTQSPDISRGPWSAELRSANESKTSGITRYRVTGLTLLPAILATEGLLDIIADIIMMPLEALMVRVVGTVFRVRAALSINDQFDVGLKIGGFINLLIAWTLQLTITGTIWGGFTLCTSWYATNLQSLLHDTILWENESSTSTNDGAN